MVDSPSLHRRDNRHSTYGENGVQQALPKADRPIGKLIGNLVLPSGWALARENGSGQGGRGHLRPPKPRPWQGFSGLARGKSGLDSAPREHRPRAGGASQSPNLQFDVAPRVGVRPAFTTVRDKLVNGDLTPTRGYPDARAIPSYMTSIVWVVIQMSSCWNLTFRRFLNSTRNWRLSGTSGTSTKTRLRSSRNHWPSCRHRPRMVWVSDETAPKRSSSSSNVSAISSSRPAGHR